MRDMGDCEICFNFIMSKINPIKPICWMHFDHSCCHVFWQWTNPTHQDCSVWDVQYHTYPLWVFKNVIHCQYKECRRRVINFISTCAHALSKASSFTRVVGFVPPISAVPGFHPTGIQLSSNPYWEPATEWSWRCAEAESLLLTLVVWKGELSY